MSRTRMNNLKTTLTQLLLGTSVLSGAIILTFGLGYGMYLLMGNLVAS